MRFALQNKLSCSRRGSIAKHLVKSFMGKTRFTLPTSNKAYLWATFHL